MKIEICTIGLGKNLLDNNYTFYNDGQIRRLYDPNYLYIQWGRMDYTKRNSSRKKDKIFVNCNEELKDQINEILTKNNY